MQLRRCQPHGCGYDGRRTGPILIAVVVLAFLGEWTWILPAVVLVVAFHFFPTPWIFRRTIDYYLSTVMLIVAVIGLNLCAQATVSWQTTCAITGIGAALVTSTYRLWIRLTARRVLKEYDALPE